MFREMVCEFLPRQPQDTQEIYNLRLKEASYRSYVGQIVRAYAGALFASPYTIRSKRNDEEVELDPCYASFKEDCNSQGVDLTNFFKDRFRRALVTCTSYWLVELTEDSEACAKLIPIEAKDVLDWEADADGAYAWVKVFDRSMRRPNPAAPPVTVDTWKIYFPDRVDTYQISYDPKKPPKATAHVPLISSDAHVFARVPILSLRLPEGLWLLDAASDAQVEHFRLSCALGWSLRRSAYPLGVFNLESGSDPPKTGPGIGVILGKEESFGWAEPGGSALSILREELKAQKDEIYRVSQQMAMSADSSAASVGRSGLSKLADAAAADACLRDYAYFVREAIEATFELISNARGDESTIFSIEGLNTFNSQDVETIIDVAKTAKDLGIEEESDTFRVESHCRIADMVLPADTQQGVKDQIRKEISEAPPKKEPPKPNGESRTTTVLPTPANGQEE